MLGGSDMLGGSASAACPAALLRARGFGTVGAITSVFRGSAARPTKTEEMMQINRRQFGASVLATVSGVVAAPAVLAQQKFEMKLAYFVGDQHAMSRWLIKWSDNLEKESGGRITVKRFPGAQMGPMAQHYDFARTGQADVSWFLHGTTPGRFPLTELVQLPYLVGSSEIGTKTLNDPELRSKYLDAEHRGIKLLLLLTHQPGNVHTIKKPIRTTDDMKGMRLRFASPTIRDFVAALGGTPVGVVATEQVEQLQKGTIDGTFIDYGGAGIAFKMGGLLKYSTEMYSYVSSFGVGMNEDFWNKLPPDLKQLVVKSMTGVEKEVGEAWDALDIPGKKALMDGGGEAIRLSPEENAKFRKIGAEVAEAKVKELEGKGLPARPIYTMLKSLSEKHAKTSKNFWN
jgi:TRAP-type C4-dicarboxylate transport system substrate-binding protein